MALYYDITYMLVMFTMRVFCIKDVVVIRCGLKDR